MSEGASTAHAKDFDAGRDGRSSYTMFAFQLTPEVRECADYFKEIRQEDVRLEAWFTRALPNAVTAILYAEFQN